ACESGLSVQGGRPPSSEPIFVGVGHDVVFSSVQSTDKLTTPILHDSEFCSDSDGYFGGVRLGQAWMDFCGLSFFFIAEVRPIGHNITPYMRWNEGTLRGEKR